MSEPFNDSLYECLLITEDEFKTITEIKVDGNPTLKTDLPELTRLETFHKGVEAFYRKTNNGWQLNWKKEKGQYIGGNIEFAETRHLFANTETFGFYDEDTDEDADIRFFHPFDYCSPETCVGFIIKPETIYQSVYYMNGDYELSNLDLDFQGYTQMAVEARVFNHWQIVLLYYMGDIDLGASETETFKTEMPKIFANWTWENFIEKFESLRLSKNP